jgi:hypothetical protein
METKAMTDEHARQARIEAWWAQREQQYRNRPEVRQEIERIRAEAQQQHDEADARLQYLEARSGAGAPGAERALNEAYTWLAVGTDAPEPSAKDDPGEWRAFFRQEYGRDMPLNAEYQAQKHQIEAAAPADMGGWAPRTSKPATRVASTPPSWQLSCTPTGSEARRRKPSLLPRRYELTDDGTVR